MIDANKYVNIRSIVNHFGNDVCIKLPHIHAITGCDTTSYFNGVGKVKVLKKIVGNPDLLSLLNDFGESVAVSDALQDKVTKFIQRVCYSGQENESLVQTRVRLYKKMR